MPDRALTFGRCRLQPRRGLISGTREVKLTPKALALLSFLAERPGEVVTKDELFTAVWPESTVGDAALVTCIQEVRSALRDDARQPRYIETLHRRGYRFIAAVQSAEFKVQSSKTAPTPSTQHPAPTLVGWEAELEYLQMKYQLFQQVALARDLPEKRLRRGDVATIVDRHPASGGGPGYSIEIFNTVGETIAVTVVAESFLQELTADEIMHVRSLAEAI